MSRKPSITICPASVAVTVELSPQHSSAMANSVGAIAEPSSGASSECTWSSSATSVWPGLVERRRRQDQDRGVDGEREHQRDGRIDGREA